MAHPDQLQPVYRNPKPILLVFEVSEDPARRRTDAAFLRQVLTSIKRFPSYGSNFFPRIFLYPFGPGCDPTPQTASDPEDIRPEAMTGRETRSLEQALMTLNQALSRNGALKLPGFHTPAVLLFCRCAPDENARKALAELRRNPWFCKSLPGIICLEGQPDPGLTAGLLGADPRTAEKHRLLYRLPPEGCTPEEVEYITRCFFFTGKAILPER